MSAKNFMEFNSGKKNDILNRYFTTSMEQEDYSWDATSRIRHRDDSFDVTEYGEKVYYEWNQYAYRNTNDSFGKNKILYTGCSQTYGFGVSVDAIWGEQLSKIIGDSATNLGRPGAGIASLVDSVYNYLDNFDKPDRIYALFPGLNRVDLAITKGNHQSADRESCPFRNKNRGAYHSEVSDESGEFALFQSHIYRDHEQPKVAKKPFQVENIYPYSDAAYKNIRAIIQLEVACKVAGIDFMWSTWGSDFIATIDKALELGYEFKNYVDVGSRDWTSHDGKYLDLGCHTEYEEKYRGYFYEGCDTNTHMGAHHHIHVAEAFYNKTRQKSAEAGSL